MKKLNWLVLLCIEADFCVQIRIFQHFARSTHSAFFSRANFSNFQKKFRKFSKLFDKFFSREYLILARKLFSFHYCKCLSFELIFVYTHRSVTTQVQASSSTPSTPDTKESCTKTRSTTSTSWSLVPPTARTVLLPLCAWTWKRY